MISSVALSRGSAMLLAFFLDGCANQAQHQQVGQTASASQGYAVGQNELKECDKLLNGNSFSKKNAFTYQKCVVQAKERFHLFASDFDKAEDYKRLELAEQYSAGKISSAQFNSALADYELQMNSIRMARANSEASTLASQQQASAAANQGLANAGMTLMAAGQRMTPQQRAAILSGTQMPPTYVAPVTAPMMRTTNCNAMGNTLNCTSF
jgi:hypothetical protein